MNRYRQILWGIGLLLLVVLMGGCAKQPINSDVEGFWQLERFTTLADGETHEPERIYYGINRYVVEISEKQGSQRKDMVPLLAVSLIRRMARRH